MPKPANSRATRAISAGDPTRMAPCRSAVTRDIDPSRSASAPWAAAKSSFTARETLTSVVYAGTSCPYRAARDTAKRARSSHWAITSRTPSR